MNYRLSHINPKEKTSTLKVIQKLVRLIREERTTLQIAMCVILLNSGLQLLSPYLVGRTIDRYIQHKDYRGVLVNAALIGAVALCAFGTSYAQARLMGGVGQRMLFKLRNTVFLKLQELPLAFFNSNKTGDLISRINNDTDKINQFFAQSLMQFVGTLATMSIATVFLLSINLKLGMAALTPAILIYLFTRFTASWIKEKNAVSLRTTGGLSAEIQESLANFKVIIAFNRRDYFRKRFAEANEENYLAARKAGVANNIFIPVYGFFGSIAQLIVLTFGIYLISTGQFTIGLLVSYLAYSNNFYQPLQRIAALWTSFQLAMAAADRVSHILNMESNLPVIPSAADSENGCLVELRHVHFGYEGGQEILHHVSFKLQKGKTYALVGPTGGGKTTTASLLARLYDPLQGEVLLDGRDIRSFSPEERTQKIGFILQEPILFSSTIAEKRTRASNIKWTDGGAGDDAPPNGDDPEGGSLVGDGNGLLRLDDQTKRVREGPVVRNRLHRRQRLETLHQLASVERDEACSLHALELLEDGCAHFRGRTLHLHGAQREDRRLARAEIEEAERGEDPHADEQATPPRRRQPWGRARACQGRSRLSGHARQFGAAACRPTRRPGSRSRPGAGPPARV